MFPFDGLLASAITGNPFHNTDSFHKMEHPIVEGPTVDDV